MSEVLHIDAPPVTRDEAVELCIYHLRLAAMYYEATPDDDNKQLEEELQRVCARDDDWRAHQSALDFLSASWRFHDELKKQQGD